MLAQQDPYLYKIVQLKQVSVASVLSQNPLNLSFRRNLTGTKLARWVHVVQRLMGVELNDQLDVFTWSLTSFVLFFGQIYVFRF